MNEVLSLAHLILRPSLPSEGPPPLLVLLHGLGSDEGDLVGLAKKLDGRFFCISVRAPYALDAGANAWFHVRFTSEGTLIEAGEAEASRLRILRFLDESIEAYGLDARRVFLMGFSQGAIMSLCVALTRPEKVAGVVVMSGRLLPEILPLIAPAERLRGLPFFVSHGTMDSVLPVRLGRSIQEALSALPVELEYREYGMGHEIGTQSLEDISGWLSLRLGALASPG